MRRHAPRCSPMLKYTQNEPGPHGPGSPKHPVIGGAHPPDDARPIHHYYFLSMTTFTPEREPLSMLASPLMRPSLLTALAARIWPAELAGVMP